jgi:Tachylectin
MRLKILGIIFLGMLFSGCSQLENENPRVKTQVIFTPSSGCSQFTSKIDSEFGSDNIVSTFSSFDPDKLSYEDAEYIVSWGDGTSNTYYNFNNSPVWSTIEKRYLNFSNTTKSYTITFSKSYKTIGSSSGFLFRNSFSCSIQVFSVSARPKAASVSGFGITQIPGNKITIYAQAEVYGEQSDQSLVRGFPTLRINNIEYSLFQNGTGYDSIGKVHYFYYKSSEYTVPFDQSSITISFVQSTNGYAKSASQTIQVASSSYKDGTVLGVFPTGEMKLYKYGSPYSSFAWVIGASGGGQTVGAGWNSFTKIVAGGDGSVLGVLLNGEVKLYRYAYVNGAFTWVIGASGGGQTVGAGWNSFTKIVAGGDGTVLGVLPSGEMKLYRYAYVNGSFTWIIGANGGQTIGAGWNSFDKIVAGSDGTILAVLPSGEMKLYKYAYVNGNFTFTIGASGGQTVGAGWNSFDKIIAAK